MFNMTKDLKDLYKKLKDPAFAGETDSLSAKVFNLKNCGDPQTIVEICALDTAVDCFCAQQLPVFGPGVSAAILLLSFGEVFSKLNGAYGVSIEENRLKSFSRILLGYFAGNLTGNMKVLLRGVLVSVAGSVLPLPIREVTAVSLAAAAYSSVSVAGKIYMRSVQKLTAENAAVTAKALNETGKLIAREINLESEFRECTAYIKAKLRENELVTACRERLALFVQKFKTEAA